MNFMLKENLPVTHLLYGFLPQMRRVSQPSSRDVKQMQISAASFQFWDQLHMHLQKPMQLDFPCEDAPFEIPAISLHLQGEHHKR